MFLLSYKMLKISTRQDRQLRMRRNCHVLGGSVLVEEHYIVCFQIIGFLAPNIAECFPPGADWFYLKWIHRHFAQNGDLCFFYTLGTKIVLILLRQAAFCTCFDLSSAWRAYLNSVKTELISKCLQTFAAFVHKYHVFESGGEFSLLFIPLYNYLHVNDS